MEETMYYTGTSTTPHRTPKRSFDTPVVATVSPLARVTSSCEGRSSPMKIRVTTPPTPTRLPTACSPNLDMYVDRLEALCWESEEREVIAGYVEEVLAGATEMLADNTGETCLQQDIAYEIQQINTIMGSWVAMQEPTSWREDQV